MADHFSFFQALPLAWYELHDDAFCLRLFHHHNPGEFKPRVTAIAVEYRGWMSGSGVVSVSDELHLQRASKVCAESDAKDFAELFRTAGLFSLPSLATRPIMIAGSKFELEMRWGKEYRFIRFDAPAMLTKERGMESLYAITTALMRIAEIPPSTVFYGDRR